MITLPNIPIIGGLLSTAWPWILEDLDHGMTVEGQFFPEDLQINIGSKFGATTALNREFPVLQFLHGNGDTVSFTTLIFARHFLVKIEDLVEALQSLTRRWPDIKRPPVCMFSVGTSIGIQVVVESVGGLQIAETKKDGTLRSVEAKIKMRRYEPFSIEEQPQTGANTVPPSTRYVKTVEGDLFERIAREEYGNPLKGIHLREENPTVGDTLEAGETLKLLPVDHPRMKRALAPGSVALGDGKAEKAQLFKDRSRTRNIYGI